MSSTIYIDGDQQHQKYVAFFEDHLDERVWFHTNSGGRIQMWNIARNTEMGQTDLRAVFCHDGDCVYSVRAGYITKTYDKITFEMNCGDDGLEIPGLTEYTRYPYKVPVNSTLDDLVIAFIQQITKESASLAVVDLILKDKK